MEENALKKYKEWLLDRYANINTRQAYTDIADRIEGEPNEETIRHCYSKYDRNTLNRAALNTVIECFEIDLVLPKQRSRKGKKEVVKFIEKEEIDFLIRNLPDFYSLCVQLLFETGLRLSELINLERKNIDLKERYVKGIGKGLKPFKEFYGPNTAKKLGRYLIYLDRRAGNKVEYPFRYFDTPRKHIKFHNKKFWRELKIECKKLGLENVHPHKVRHALGHHLRADKRFDLVEIKEKLRHKSVQTTQIYATATREEVDSKMKQVYVEETGDDE